MTTAEPRLAELTRALRAMAERANTARGASWEHGARSATTLLAAASLLDSLSDQVRQLVAETWRLGAQLYRDRAVAGQKSREGRCPVCGVDLADAELERLLGGKAP